MANLTAGRPINPQMLIYLAEAAGISRVLLNKAKKVAFNNSQKMMSMSSAIRRIIPWAMLEKALLGKATMG